MVSKIDRLVEGVWDLLSGFAGAGALYLGLWGWLELKKAYNVNDIYIMPILLASLALSGFILWPVIQRSIPYPNKYNDPNRFGPPQ